MDGQRRGVVATFQDVKQLQNSEQKIRLKLHEKGLVAKYAFNDILGDSSVFGMLLYSLVLGVSVLSCGRWAKSICNAF